MTRNVKLSTSFRSIQSRWRSHGGEVEYLFGLAAKEKKWSYLTTQNSSRKKEQRRAVRYGKNIGSDESSTNNHGEDEENANSQKTAGEEEIETQRKTVAHMKRWICS